ncbi:Two pore potassium channel protein sup-9 [Aphelenchoides besseyi]|nr:Two pore potassium channel protein sup-9 [Aphelenchoides besseyi]
MRFPSKSNEQLKTLLGSVNLDGGRLTVTCFVLIVYVFVASIIFRELEGPVSQTERAKYQELRVKWTRKLSESTPVESKVEDLLKEIQEIESKRNDSMWTLSKTFFYLGGMLTTNGYGEDRPQTREGKVFILFFAIIGIPICSCFFIALTDRLRRPAVWFRLIIHEKFANTYDEKQRNIIYLIFLGYFVIISLFIIPSLGFMIIESEWTFIDAFYYCYMSMSTIELGEQQLGENSTEPHRSIYKIIEIRELDVGVIC